MVVPNPQHYSIKWNSCTLIFLLSHKWEQKQMCSSIKIQNHEWSMSIVSDGLGSDEMDELELQIGL